MTDEAMRALVDDISFALDGRHNWVDIDDARHRILGTVVDKAFLRWLRAALSAPAGLDDLRAENARLREAVRLLQGNWTGGKPEPAALSRSGQERED